MSVDVTTRDAVQIITLARPARRNAVDAETARALARAFRAFDADLSLSVAVLTGADQTFCAGYDLQALATGEHVALDETGDGPMGPTRLSLSKPVIAAIEGYAVAGGLELALWCDLRVVADNAVMGVFCRRFGVPLIDMGTVRLPRLIGHSRAMDLILTGREVHAEEALAIGLANRVVPAGQALEAACVLAAQIAAFPAQCMRGDRRSALEQWGLSEEEAMRNELRHGRITLHSGETATGAAAFHAGKGRHGSFS